MLLPFGQLREPLLVPCPRPAVLRVRPAVLDHAAAIQMQDPCDRGVQEGQVVADDDESPLVRPEELHQPRLRVHVEVVRRLVQQEEIRAAEQDPAQLQPPALSTGKGPDRQMQPALGQADARRDRRGFGLRLIAAELPVLLLEPCEPRDLALGVGLLERDPGLLEPTAEVDEIPRAQDVLEAGPFMVGSLPPRILPQVPDGAAADDRARRGWLLPRQDPERAGLPGAVAPDHADLVPGSQVERETLEHGAAGDLDRQISSLERDHGAALRSSERWGAADGTYMADLLGEDDTGRDRGPGVLEDGSLAHLGQWYDLRGRVDSMVRGTVRHPRDHPTADRRTAVARTCLPRASWSP